MVSTAQAADLKLRNVSYDPTRELYTEFNAAFANRGKRQKGDTVSIEQSHGGSGKQARALLDGLDGDVATLALGYDIDTLAPKASYCRITGKPYYPITPRLTLLLLCF